MVSHSTRPLQVAFAPYGLEDEGLGRALMSPRAFDGTRPGPPVGHYTYRPALDSWTWSDGIYALHGYQPGEVPATTDVLMRHKHPDDRARVLAVLEGVVRDGLPFSCYHRVIDRDERVRSVLAVGRGQLGDAGEVESVEGFYADLTDVRRTETQADVEVALARIAEHRAVIEQAKGVLMFATGCDADAAFDLLRRRSMTRNVKLHEVAHHLVDALGRDLRAGLDSCTAVMGWLDGTAHRLRVEQDRRVSPRR